MGGKQEEGRWAGAYWKEWILLQRLQDTRHHSSCPHSGQHNFGTVVKWLLITSLPKKLHFPKELRKDLSENVAFKI